MALGVPLTPYQRRLMVGTAERWSLFCLPNASGREGAVEGAVPEMTVATVIFLVTYAVIIGRQAWLNALDEAVHAFAQEDEPA